MKAPPRAMHIGLDFDNTVVTYDHVFHHHGVLRGLISPAVLKHKKHVRDAIRGIPDGEREWTLLQGVVYGTMMAEAEPAPGVEQFLRACRRRRARVSIISHKTLYPALGERVNLRSAARRWLGDRGFTTRFGIEPGDIHFVGTLARKLDLVRRSGCTHFVDDLTEVLTHPRFPSGVAKLLYSPGGWHGLPADIIPFRSWGEIGAHLLGRP